MSTVLDSFVLEFGIDHQKFADDKRQIDDILGRTKQEVESFGKSVEQQSMKMSDAFGMVRKGALGIMGAIAGGEVASFIYNMTNMDAATGRLAYTMGTGVSNLSTWQGMVRLLGGEASSANSALGTLQQTLTNVRQGGGMFEGGFSQLMSNAGANGLSDSADTILRKIQRYISTEMAAGRMKPEDAATNLRRIPGMNEDVLNVLIQTTAQFNALGEQAKALGVATNESVKAAQALQRAFVSLTLAVDNLYRKVAPFLGLATKPLSEIGKDDVKAAIGASIGPANIGKPGPDASWMEKNLSDYAILKWLGILPEEKKPDAAPVVGGTGTRGDRNNNPGNIEYGAFAQSHGATGSDGRFAIFPDKATGESAMADLLAKNYQGLTLSQIQQKWVGNPDPNYVASMSRATGYAPDDVPNLQDPEVRNKLMKGMSRGEGTTITGAKGAAAARTSDARSGGSTSTNSTHIGQIVLPGVTDADSFASEVGPALNRFALSAPANTGLT